MSSPPKKYVCGYCARAFTRSEHKQRHERSHTNEKPFHCSYCTSAFVRRDLLQRHCRTVHNIRLVSRAHSKEPRAAKGGSVVNLEPSWKPKNNKGSVPTHIGAEGVTLPTAGAFPQVSPKLSPPTQTDSTPTLYSSMSPPTALSNSPESAMSPLETQTSSVTKSDGYPPRIPHPHQRPEQMAANPAGYRTASSASETESNIVASAKALLQLAPNISSADPSHISPRHELGTPFDPSINSCQFDTWQVLRVAKALEQYYYPEDLKYPLNEFFYIGFSVITKKTDNVLPFSHVDVLSYDSISSQEQPHTFKVGLAYSILAVGCVCMKEKNPQYEKLSSELIGKARDSLIEKSVSSSNSSANQLKLLSGLYLLNNVCLSYFEDTSILNILERTTHAALQTLPQHLIESEMDLLWKIYVSVSQAKPLEKPPVFYSYFLGQKLNGSLLVDVMRTFVNTGLEFPIVGFAAQVIISTVTNELNSLRSGELLQIYSSRLELHTALGNINRLVNSVPNSDVFELFRKKLIIDAPQQCKELLEASIFEIQSASQINLLSATLGELDLTLDFQNFMKSHLNSSFSSFVEDARNFFQTEDNYSPRLSNNFGFVSFPLIFNETFSRLGSVPSSVSKLSMTTFEKSNFDLFILQWYTIFVKTLVKVMANNQATPINQVFSKNIVFQSLLAIMNERGKETFETGVDNIIPIFEEVTRVCDSWLQQKNIVSGFQQNLFHFCRELFVLSVNQGRFDMGDVYANNESLLVRSHRSKSIGSFDAVSLSHPAQSLTGPRMYPGLPLPASGYSHSVATKNYVLKGDVTTFPISPAQKKNPQYSPLESAIVVPGNGYRNMEIPTILPPLHATLRSQPLDNLKGK